MSGEAFLDPDRLRSLAARAADLAAVSRDRSRRAVTIATAAATGAEVGDRLADVAAAAAALHRRCVDAAAAMDVAATTGFPTLGWTDRRRDAPVPDGDVGEALAVLRAHRVGLDADGDGRVDERELRDAVASTDPDIAAAAAMVLDGAPVVQAPTSDETVRPTVAELLLVVNLLRPAERDRVIAAVAADVARRDQGRAVGVELVAAGTPFDAVELEEARIMYEGDVSVAPPGRLRTWDVPVPDVDLSILTDDDLDVPPATAAIALTYRSETTFHEYTVDPLSDTVPQAAAEVLSDLSDQVSIIERAGPEHWHPVTMAVHGALGGVTAWNLVDDLIGDDHPRADTTVVMDATFYDATGAVLGGVDAIGIERTGVTAPLLPTLGSVIVVPAAAARRADEDD